MTNQLIQTGLEQEILVHYLINLFLQFKMYIKHI